MFTLEVKKIIKVMRWARRLGFIVCLGGGSFFVYFGYKRIEYRLTASAMIALIVVPILILFISGRWWEGLAGKKYISFSFKNKSVNENIKKCNYIFVREEAFNSGIVHI